MNIFFHKVYCEVSLNSLNRLIEYYNPESCYYVYDIDTNITYGFHVDNKKIEGVKTSEAYYRSDALAGKYSGYAFEKDCPPVDEALLNAMSKHESSIIKMLEREPEFLNFHMKPFSLPHSPSYEDRVRQYHSHLRYWNHMLDAAEIGIAVFINIPHEIFTYIIYCLCKIKEIAVVFASPYGQIPGFCYFAKDIFDRAPSFLDTYQRLLAKYEDMTVDDITISPDEVNNVYDRQTNKKSDKIPHFMKQQRKNHIITYSVIKILREKGLLSTCLMVWSGIRWIISARIGGMKLAISYNNLSVEPDYTSNYIYFPLHKEPEASINPQGGVFTHQYIAISILSFHLPSHIKIYVKEHPLQFKRSYGREKELYYDLVNLPNVQLVNRSSDTYQLLEKCIAVASITGTAGFEGLFLRKPFLMFGSHLTMYAPGTFNIRNNEDCRQALEYILSNKQKHTIKELKIFMKAVGEELFQCISSNLHASDLGVSITDKEKNLITLIKGYTKVLDEQLYPNTPRTIKGVL